MNNNDKSFKKWIPPFILAVLLILLLQLLTYLPDIRTFLQTLFGVLTPFILGAGIAYVLNIPCKKIDVLLQKTRVNFISKRHRGFSVLLTYLLTILVLSLLINAVVPILVIRFADLARTLPGYFENILENPLFINYVNQVETILPTDFDLRSTLSLSNLLQPITSGILMSVRNIAGISSSLITFALGLVSSIYYLLYSDVIIKFFVRIFYAFIPTKAVDIFLRYGRNLNLYFYKYIYCQMIDGLILGTAATIGLTIIGIEYAILWGLLLAVFNIIPYFGSIFGTIFVIIFALFSQGFATALITTAFLLTIQQIDSNIIQPKLLGSSLKLNPLVIIISISIGGSYYGILGMIAAIPIATLTRDILSDLISYSESKK